MTPAHLAEIEARHASGKLHITKLRKDIADLLPLAKEQAEQIKTLLDFVGAESFEQFEEMLNTTDCGETFSSEGGLVATGRVDQ
jgi:hypothetical protein